MPFRSQNYMEFSEEESVGTPPSGIRLYAKIDNRLYYKDDSGDEILIAASGVVDEGSLKAALVVNLLGLGNNV
jgi:hypothetical protein